MPRECCDYAKVLSSENFLSLESFEQGKLPCRSNCEDICDLTQMSTDYAENNDKYKQSNAPPLPPPPKNLLVFKSSIIILDVT